jgi:hypothetical protein
MCFVLFSSLRAERAVKRNFTALKTLLGDTPLPEETVKQKLASKIDGKRQPIAQSRDAEEKYAPHSLAWLVD